MKLVEGTKPARRTRVVAQAGVEFRVFASEQFDGFWRWYESPEWEPETVAVYRRFARPGVTIADIGAWIGPTVLLGAALGAEVVAVEPDPLAAEFLRVNVDLNPELRARITVVEAAIDAADGVSMLVSGGRGGDSLSHLASVKPAGGATWEVRAVSAASFFARPDVAGVELVKIDAEAAEYTIVPAMAPLISAKRPSIYVATHPNLLYDRRTPVSRIRSARRVVAANRRMMRALAVYRHHYAWVGTFEDRRRRNVLNSLVPLPLRSALLIGGHLFTDRTLA